MRLEALHSNANTTKKSATSNLSKKKGTYRSFLSFFLNFSDSDVLQIMLALPPAGWNESPLVQHQSILRSSIFYSITYLFYQKSLLHWALQHNRSSYHNCIRSLLEKIGQGWKKSKISASSTLYVIMEFYQKWVMLSKAQKELGVSQKDDDGAEKWSGESESLCTRYILLNILSWYYASGFFLLVQVELVIVSHWQARLLPLWRLPKLKWRLGPPPITL